MVASRPWASFTTTKLERSGLNAVCEVGGCHTNKFCVHVFPCAGDSDIDLLKVASTVDGEILTRAKVCH